jgi:hypothetical protein
LSCIFWIISKILATVVLVSSGAFVSVSATHSAISEVPVLVSSTLTSGVSGVVISSFRPSSHSFVSW